MPHSQGPPQRSTTSTSDHETEFLPEPGPLGSRVTKFFNVIVESFGDLNPDGSTCYGKS